MVVKESSVFNDLLVYILEPCFTTYVNDPKPMSSSPQSHPSLSSMQSRRPAASAVFSLYHQIYISNGSKIKRETGVQSNVHLMS